MRLEIASSLKELSVGGGGQTRLSIISTFRSPPAMTGGGSIKNENSLGTLLTDTDGLNQRVCFDSGHFSDDAHLKN